MIKIKVSDFMGKYHEKTQRVDFDTLEKLCKYFNCNTQDLIEYIPDETQE